MGMKPRKPPAPPAPKTCVLQVRPRGVGPEWWQRYERLHEVDGIFVLVIDYAWATVTEGGGWSIGLDRTAAVTESDLHDLVSAWYEEHEEPGWPWEFRLCKIAAP